MDGAPKDYSENGATQPMENSKGEMDEKTCSKESSIINANNILGGKKDDLDSKTGAMTEKMENSSSDVSTYLQRISLLVKQKKTTEALEICDQGLEGHPSNSRLLEKKSKIFRQLLKFNEAFDVVKEWVKNEPENPMAKKEYSKLQEILKLVEDEDSDHLSEEKNAPVGNTEKSEGVEDVAEASEPHDESQPETVQNGHEAEAVNLKGDISQVSQQSHPTSTIRLTTRLNIDEDVLSKISSSRGVSRSDKKELRSFQQSEHLFVDTMNKWLYRDPPRGLAIYEYALCKRYHETGRCTFGEKCTKAHSEAELLEWNKRIAERKQQLQQSDSRAHGGTYIEQLLEKLMCQESPKMKVVDNLDFVKVHVNSDLRVNVSSKKSSHAWTFTVTSKICLHCVALMMDSNRSYFNISSISVGPRKTQKYQNIDKQCQEWINQEAHSKGQGEFVYRVKVIFKTDIYGTFRQSIVFDFGFDAILMREVQVESAPATDPEKIMKEITLTAAHRWNEKTVTLIPFEPRPVTHTDAERALMAKYTVPRPDSKFYHTGRNGSPLGKHNFRLWMHEMLYIEEMAQLGYISRFNVTTSLNLQNHFVHLPETKAIYKYALDGELFAKLKLADDLSEDSMAGKLILQSSDVAWIADGKKERPGKVYEAVIEEKCKNIIYMRLSGACVKDLRLKCEQDFCAQIQFQLNRLPMCERHLAVDRLPSLDIVFPPLESMPSKLELDDVAIEKGNQKKCLNEKQVDAVKMILAGPDCKLPPLLLVGPFGTGKTFTVAQAMLQVLKQEGTRILLCTHSNSAADIYINEFLHDFKEAPPLRVLQKFRWIETVPEKVLQFTLQEHEGPNAGTFRSPTIEDIMAHKIIIVTLSSARIVVDLDLPKDTFTHIFIDEAGQSLECETIIPLGVATENTRIVFAGDHMQMSVEVYSDLARQQELHVSLLERLHDYYPKECVYKVMLCENYRSHKAIVDFTSELFYDNKVISSGNIIAHEQFYPLTFYAAKGEEVQHDNSTGFYNMSEVYEIVERVDELKKKWPPAWGPFDKNGISIVAPYSDQVARIRAELKKRKLMNVNVERILNVQGKQYRVLVISITRTRLTCRSDPSLEENGNFGFLSNMKLLNTAITRAQSLVVVVGDPVSVCLVGECRKIWEYFLEICHFNDSLHGISWVPLREQLDRAELMKSFVLNPLAPEFVPKPRPPILPLMIAPGDHPMDPSMLHHGPWVGHHHPNLHAQVQGPIHQQLLPQRYPTIYQPPVYLSYPHLGGHMLYPGVDHHIYPGAQIPSLWKGHGFPPTNGKRLSAPIRGDPRGPRLRFHGDARHPLEYNAPHMPHSHHPLHQTYAPALVTHPSLLPDNYLYHYDPGRPLSLQAQHSSLHHPFLTTTGHLPHTLGGFGAGNHHPMIPLHQAYQHPTLQPTSSILLPYREASATTAVPSAAPRDMSDTTDSSGNSRITESPSSGIQLLPNVKHVPVHLLNKSGAKNSPAQTYSVGVSSSSQETSANHQPTQPTLARGSKSGRILSSRSYSPANYVRERSSSGTTPSTRPFSGNILPEEKPAPVPDVLRQQSESPPVDVHPRKEAVPISEENVALGRRGFQMSEEMALSTSPTLNNRRKGPSLKLNTGFSRQYSDDLPTPSYITNMIQMIDENSEDTLQGERSRGSALTELKQNRKLKKTVAQTLQQRLVRRSDDDTSTSPTPSPSSSSKPSYASVLSGSPQPRQTGLPEDFLDLDIQTPQTPKGFITPGADVEVDPLGILKSLNIGNPPQ